MNQGFLKRILVSTALSVVLGSTPGSFAADENPFVDSGSDKKQDKFAFPSPPPVPKKETVEYEKCYGVADKDENNCQFATFDGTPNDAAGTSEPCDPGAWRWVPRGLCEAIVVGTRKDGTILHGTLKPSMARGWPVKCTPYRGRLPNSQDYGL